MEIQGCEVLLVCSVHVTPGEVGAVVGACVSSCEGIAVGASVGACVGSCVGIAVGAVVGACVGSCVGVAVGAVVLLVCSVQVTPESVDVYMEPL